MLCGVGCALSPEGLSARCRGSRSPSASHGGSSHSFHLASGFCSASFGPFPLNSPHARYSAGMDTLQSYPEQHMAPGACLCTHLETCAGPLVSPNPLLCPGSFFPLGPSSPLTPSPPLPWPLLSPSILLCSGLLPDFIYSWYQDTPGKTCEGLHTGTALSRLTKQAERALPLLLLGTSRCFPPQSPQVDTEQSKELAGDPKYHTFVQDSSPRAAALGACTLLCLLYTQGSVLAIIPDFRAKPSTSYPLPTAYLSHLCL